MTTDPRCPECGERVGAGAVECFHCGAEFDAPVDGRSGESVASADGGAGRDGSGGSSGGLLARLLDPDGVVDDSLTVAVAVGVALVCAVVALFVFGTVAGGGVGLLAALVTLVGLLVWLGRQYSVFGAVRGGCYALAVALVGTPVVALTDAAEGGTFGGQVVLFLVGELLFGVVALVLVGIGYTAGKRRPEAGEREQTTAGAERTGDDGGDDRRDADLGSVVGRE